jgi:hypothetical protein
MTELDQIIQVNQPWLRIMAPNIRSTEAAAANLIKHLRRAAAL